MPEIVRLPVIRAGGHAGPALCARRRLRLGSRSPPFVTKCDGALLSVTPLRLFVVPYPKCRSVIGF